MVPLPGLIGLPFNTDRLLVPKPSRIDGTGEIYAAKKILQLDKSKTHLSSSKNLPAADLSVRKLEQLQ
jgi:hypothetical protein